MTVRAYENSILTTEVTTSSTGLAVLQLEVGIFTVKGYLKDIEVGEQTIQVNGTLAFDLPAALVAVLRLLTISTIFFIFFRTTAAEDLANALVSVIDRSRGLSRGIETIRTTLPGR
jgi:hypothetical protein